MNRPRLQRSPEEVQRRALQGALLKQMKQLDFRFTCPKCGGAVESVMGTNSPHRQCKSCDYGKEIIHGHR